MSYSEFLYALAWAALCVFLLVFVARRLTRSLARLEERRPGAFGAVISRTARAAFWVSVVCLALWYARHFLLYGPPSWYDRMGQRKVVSQKIETLGGWTNLVRDCALFAKTNDPTDFHFFCRHETNLVLPAALELLKPIDIEGVDRDGHATMTLRLFGAHSTGGHSIPNYWLLVVVDGKPDPAALAKRWPSKRSIKRLSNEVWEVF